jgi:redox-sensitive bicupin YhaK (pirin superfamily)
MGPVTLAPGHGIDVLPHPHIGLATVTYLLDGGLIHRDSLGSHQAIQPGEINWMSAGRGIVHSERTGPERRRTGSNLHALQLWVALPKAYEGAEPAFCHYAAQDEAQIRVLIGRGYGIESPVRTLTPTFMIDLMVEPRRELPIPHEYEERAAYVVAGAIQCGRERAEAGRMLVFTPRAAASVRAESAARIVLLGGDPIDGPRHIWWNFVSSSQERIEQAKRDWRERRFAAIPGDDKEFTLLPTYS